MFSPVVKSCLICVWCAARPHRWSYKATFQHGSKSNATYTHQHFCAENSSMFELLQKRAAREKTWQLTHWLKQIISNGSETQRFNDRKLIFNLVDEVEKLWQYHFGLSEFWMSYFGLGRYLVVFCGILMTFEVPFASNHLPATKSDDRWHMEIAANYFVKCSVWSGRTHYFCWKYFCSEPSFVQAFVSVWCMCVEWIPIDWVQKSWLNKRKHEK